MPDTDKRSTTIINKIYAKLDVWNKNSNLIEEPLKIAIGLSNWLPEGSKPIELTLREADEKMYADKKQQDLK